MTKSAVIDFMALIVVAAIMEVCQDGLGIFFALGIGTLNAFMLPFILIGESGRYSDEPYQKRQ